MSFKVRPARSRRTRANVIAAPCETPVTNVGGFRIPNRLYKGSPYPLFRMAVVPRGFTRRVGHATVPIRRLARMAFRLELSASSTTSWSVPDFLGLVARTSFLSTLLHRSRKAADVVNQFN